MKYMIWNNKGGVGKTFATFLLATGYAQAHPGQRVVAIDLCPQANLSEMMLGGNGKGEENLDRLYDLERTITGYIKSRYTGSRSSKIGTEATFFVPVKQYNHSMPDNLYLLPGDTDLDIGGEIIQYLGSGPQRTAWKASRLLLFDLIDSFNMSANQNTNEQPVFFIDCNPSFAVYTQLAVAVADRLIIPCTADSASIRAIYNLFRLIYGIELVEKLAKNLDDSFIDFSQRATESGLNLPRIHLFLQNKSRSHDSKASAAYRAHIEKIKKIARDAQEQNPNQFTKGKTLVHNLKDGNTLASVLNHTGLPLNQVEAKTYKIYDEMTQVNQVQVNALRNDLEECLALLG